MTEIKFTPAQNQWLEVTWFDVEQLPDVVTPAKPALFDADGKEVEAAAPETTTPGGEKRTEVKHTSYHPTQLDMLQADAAAIGTPLDEHADMLAEWHLSYVPEPPAPPVIPQVLTMRQAKIVLLRHGMLAEVNNAVSHADEETRIEWEYATEVRRDWPTLATMAAALNLDDSLLDALFVEGVTL
jgi:hypothetical protein